MPTKKKEAANRSRAKGEALSAAKAFVKRVDFKAIKRDREYSTSAAAELIKVSPRRLRTFCQEGRVECRRGPGGGYEIRGAALVAFARNPRPTGRAGRALKSLVAGSGKARKKSA